jgi:hypothetical protein
MAGVVVDGVVVKASAVVAPIRDAAVMAESAVERPIWVEAELLVVQCARAAASVIASRRPAEAILADSAAVAV